MKRLFEIQTLSENGNGGGVDPITIITGGAALFSSIFPNLFGSGKRLTMQDWVKILPGSGYWTTALRNHYFKTIHYLDHQSNMQEYCRYFVHENQASICPEMGLQNYPSGRYSSECFTRFMDILSEETRTGGKSPIGQTPGGFGATIDMNSVFLIGGGILLLMVFAKKKKK